MLRKCHNTKLKQRNCYFYSEYSSITTVFFETGREKKLDPSTDPRLHFSCQMRRGVQSKMHHTPYLELQPGIVPPPPPPYMADESVACRISPYSTKNSCNQGRFFPRSWGSPAVTHSFWAVTDYDRGYSFE